MTLTVHFSAESKSHDASRSLQTETWGVGSRCEQYWDYSYRLQVVVTDFSSKLGETVYVKELFLSDWERKASVMGQKSSRRRGKMKTIAQKFDLF